MKRALKVIAAIAIVLSLCPLASAQTPMTNTITTQSPVPSSSQTPPPGPLTPAKSIGRPHVCGVEYYPAKAVRLGAEGTVLLRFTITAQGTLTDIKVASSSGSEDLDQASAACAAQWLYKPATQNGQPIAIPWIARINWSLNRGTPLTDPTHVCPASLLPADGSITPNGRTISLLFHVTTDGTVRDVVVGRSSGSDPHDQLVVKCVSQWHYRPMMQNGQPAETLLAMNLRIPLSATEAPPVSEIIRAPDETGARDACRRPPALDKPSADTVLILTVQRDGHTKDARVWQSSGSKPIDDFAVACSASLRFVPAFENGQSVEVSIPVRLAW